MSARAEIAAAGSLALDVTVTEFYAGATEVGSGYVEWNRTEYPNQGRMALGGVDYWHVIIVVPTDPDKAEQWVEEHRTQLWHALSEAMVVDAIRPTLITSIDNPSLKAVTIEGNREAD